MDCEGSQHYTSVLSEVLETTFIQQVPLYMQLKQTQMCILTYSSFPFDLLFLSLWFRLYLSFFFFFFNHPQSVCFTFKDFSLKMSKGEKNKGMQSFLQHICLSRQLWCDFSKICRRKGDKVEPVAVAHLLLCSTKQR